MEAFLKKSASSDTNSWNHGLTRSDQEPLRKRVKLESDHEGRAEQSDNSSAPDSHRHWESEIESKGEEGESRQLDPRLTDVENALPPMQPEEDAVAEYETFKLSQSAVNDDATTPDARPWVKGKSSIYVDAFSLALDTVLDEESHLFDAKELDVFRQWKDLTYEAQFL